MVSLSTVDIKKVNCASASAVRGHGIYGSKRGPCGPLGNESGHIISGLRLAWQPNNNSIGRAAYYVAGPAGKSFAVLAVSTQRFFQDFTSMMNMVTPTMRPKAKTTLLISSSETNLTNSFTCN